MSKISWRKYFMARILQLSLILVFLLAVACSKPLSFTFDSPFAYLKNEKAAAKLEKWNS